MITYINIHKNTVISLVIPNIKKSTLRYCVMANYITAFRPQKAQTILRNASNMRFFTATLSSVYKCKNHDVDSGDFQTVLPNQNNFCQFFTQKLLLLRLLMGVCVF